MMGWRELLRRMRDGILKRRFGLRDLNILHLSGLGVLLKAFIDRGNGQGWLRLLHTVARGRRKDKPYFTFQSPSRPPKAHPRAIHPLISTNSHSPTLSLRMPENRQTHLFLMERFRDSVLSASCGVCKEVWVVDSNIRPMFYPPVSLPTTQTHFHITKVYQYSRK